VAIRCSNGYIPKIAIVATFEPENGDDPKMANISITYVRWIEDNGGEAVPILPWYTNDQIVDVLLKANGVLWMGGSRDLRVGGKFEEVNGFVLNKVLEFNNNGVYYPLFAICQGIELLHVLIANSTSVLTNYDSYDIMLPIDLNKTELKDEPMFKYFSDSDFDVITKDNSTVHLHHLGTEPAAYPKFESVNAFLEPLATGKDTTGKEFVAIVKARHYPIYAVQFHPEKVKYDRSIRKWAKIEIQHMRVNDNIGLFFIEESRKNDHKMMDSELIKYKFINTFEDMPINFAVDTFYYSYPKS